jgi:hypothetical protein
VCNNNCVATDPSEPKYFPRHQKIYLRLAAGTQFKYKYWNFSFNSKRFIRLISRFCEFLVFHFCPAPYFGISSRAFQEDGAQGVIYLEIEFLVFNLVYISYSCLGRYNINNLLHYYTILSYVFWRRVSLCTFFVNVFATRQFSIRRFFYLTTKLRIYTHSFRYLQSLLLNLAVSTGCST